MSAERNCGTCNLSIGFALTVTGRFRKDTTGRCLYKIIPPVLPACVLPYMAPVLFNPELAKGACRPSDGATCPVWEPKA